MTGRQAFSTPLPWFRLYTEFATDPKVQLLPEAMQRRFVMLLCLAGSRVTPTRDDAAIAYALRLPIPEDVDETKRVLRSAGLIDDRWYPRAWDRRQRVSDHDAAERKRRQRAASRKSGSHGCVTKVSRDSHPLEESRGEESRGEESRGDAEKNASASATPPEFAEFKAIYPKRSGSQPWKRAFAAIRARLREGHTWPELLDGARRYASYCEATNTLGSEFVLQAATFCGSERHFRESWTPPAPRTQRKQDSNIAAAQSFVESGNASH